MPILEASEVENLCTVYRKLLVAALLAILQGCAHKQEYHVRSVPGGAIRPDGVKDEKAWAEAKEIRSFVNPWNKEVSPETSLSMLKDDKYLCFFFEVSDDEIVTAPVFQRERDIEKGDRVELFFSKDKDMREYYCFEIDPEGRTLAYAARHYRQMDYDWDVPAGYRVAARAHPGGYSVEGMIPLEFLEGLTHGEDVFFGAYRAEFSREDDKLVENWLTWVDPGTASPDFHVPASLGKLVLERRAGKGNVSPAGK